MCVCVCVCTCAYVRVRVRVRVRETNCANLHQTMGRLDLDAVILNIYLILMYNETTGATTKGLAVNEQSPEHILVSTAEKCGELAEFRAQAPWDEQREGKTVTQSELAPEQTNEAPALATNASENKTTAQQRARIATVGRQRGRLKLHD